MPKKQDSERSDIKPIFKRMQKLLGMTAFVGVTTACVTLAPPNVYEKWDQTFDGVQTASMEAIGIAVDSQGNTISTARQNKTNGTNRTITVKYDSDGNQIGISQIPSTGDFKLKHSTVDTEGNIILAIEDMNGGGDRDWRIIKLDGTPDVSGNLNVLWDTAWGDKSPYSVTLGSNNDVYAIGKNWDNQAHVIKLNGATGAVECTYDTDHNVTGTRKRFQSMVINDNGTDWYYAVYPRDGSNLHAVRMDANCGSTNREDLGLDLTPTQIIYDSLSNYFYVGGNDGSQVKIKRINRDDNDNVSDVVSFPNQIFQKMLLDTSNGTPELYVANQTGSAPDTNVSLSKVSLNCPPGDNYICWDEFFNHSLLFEVDITLLGFIEIINDFSNERVVDLFFYLDEVYLVTSSQTSQIAGFIDGLVTEYVGYDKNTGQGRIKYQVSNRDAVAAAQSPVDSDTVVFVANKVSASDPEPVLYTTKAVMKPVPAAN